MNKSFGTDFSETGASNTTGASAVPTQQSEHRRTDHNRDSESAQARQAVKDSQQMGESGHAPHGSAMDLDTETPAQTNPNWLSLDSLQKDFSSAFHLCKSCKSSLILAMAVALCAPHNASP